VTYQTTLSDLEGHSPIASIVKCAFSCNCEATSYLQHFNWIRALHYTFKIAELLVFDAFSALSQTSGQKLVKLTNISTIGSW